MQVLVRKFAHYEKTGIHYCIPDHAVVNKLAENVKLLTASQDGGQAANHHGGGRHTHSLQSSEVLGEHHVHMLLPPGLLGGVVGVCVCV